MYISHYYTLREFGLTKIVSLYIYNHSDHAVYIFFTTLLSFQGMLKACGRPLIDAVFGGTLLQTVKCSDCGHLSKTYEDFLDLSLPLPSTSAKTLFNGTSRMHKSASLSLSKYQKKKEKANARKGVSKIYFREFVKSFLCS